MIATASSDCFCFSSIGSKDGSGFYGTFSRLSHKSPPQSLRRLEHEYALASKLDPAWAAKPLALTRHDGRTLLVLKDPGGEPPGSASRTGPWPTARSDSLAEHRRWLGDSARQSSSVRPHTKRHQACECARRRRRQRMADRLRDRVPTAPRAPVARRSRDYCRRTSDCHSPAIPIRSRASATMAASFCSSSTKAASRRRALFFFPIG
jgi:hypothetical protein